jgi:transposase-like protein
VILAALGIIARGEKHILGVREASTESTRVVIAARRSGGAGLEY